MRDVPKVHGRCIIKKKLRMDFKNLGHQNEYPFTAFFMNFWTHPPIDHMSLPKTCLLACL